MKNTKKEKIVSNSTEFLLTFEACKDLISSCCCEGSSKFFFFKTFNFPSPILSVQEKLFFGFFWEIVDQKNSESSLQKFFSNSEESSIGRVFWYWYVNNWFHSVFKKWTKKDRFNKIQRQEIWKRKNVMKKVWIAKKKRFFLMKNNLLNLRYPKFQCWKSWV